jgi:lipoyl synthase
VRHDPAGAGSGGTTHLFSFFPEAQSSLAEHVPPPMEQYRRIQLARYLIDKDLQRAEHLIYGDQGQIIDFNMTASGVLNEIIDSGEPFRTSGCEGYDGQVACNRPYANSRPGPDIRNYWSAVRPPITAKGGFWSGVDA